MPVTPKPRTPASPDDESELWENTTAGRVCLRFYNQQGMLVDKLVGSRNKFQITPKERLLNQEMAADDDLDVFKNGTFAPVRLVESAEDLEAIRNNPNLVTDVDMKAMLSDRRSTKALQERLDAITNPYALKRMLEIANEDEGTTARQVKSIEDRLRAVSPATYAEVTAFAGAVSTRELGPS